MAGGLLGRWRKQKSHIRVEYTMYTREEGGFLTLSLSPLPRQHNLPSNFETIAGCDPK